MRINGETDFGLGLHLFQLQVQLKKMEEWTGKSGKKGKENRIRDSRGSGLGKIGKKLAWPYCMYGVTLCSNFFHSYFLFLVGK